MSIKELIANYNMPATGNPQTVDFEKRDHLKALHFDGNTKYRVMSWDWPYPWGTHNFWIRFTKDGSDISSNGGGHKSGYHILNAIRSSGHWWTGWTLSVGTNYVNITSFNNHLGHQRVWTDLDKNINDGEWHNISFRYHYNNPCFFYVDGKFYENKGNNIWTHFDSLYGVELGVGTRVNMHDHHINFEGDIAEYTHWDFSNLSEAEHLTLYKNGEGLFYGEEL